MSGLVRLLGFAVVALCLGAVFSGPAVALDASIDADGDDHADAIETRLGSSPSDSAKTPESVALPASCRDGLDNDADGLEDAADPGCTRPPLETAVFPAAGSDVFESEITLNGYRLVLGSPDPICLVDFKGRGPTVVQRSAPNDLGGGLREVDAEIVAMQLTGKGTILPGSVNCPLPQGDLIMTLVVDPGKTSSGKITDTNPDPGSDFPATSSFDLFFLIDTEAGLLSGGPPDGPPGSSVNMANTIKSIVPYVTPGLPNLNPTCYTVASASHMYCPIAPPRPIDHFQLHGSPFPTITIAGVALEDEFGQLSRASVLGHALDLIGVPTKKTPPGEEILDFDHNLKCYRLRGVGFRPAKVEVRDQFELESIVAKRPRRLCVPAKVLPQALPPIGLDSFACYDMTVKSPRPFQRRVIDLEDRFGLAAGVLVVRPSMYCTPVSVNDMPIVDPLARLKCYRIKAPPFSQSLVGVEDQFVGLASLSVGAGREICLPAEQVVESKVQDKDTKFFGVFAGTDAEDKESGSEFDPCRMDIALGRWRGWSSLRTTVLTEKGIIDNPPGVPPCDQNGAAAGLGDPDRNRGAPNGQATEKNFRQAIAALKPDGTAWEKPVAGDELVVHVASHGVCPAGVASFFLDQTDPDKSDEDGEILDFELRRLLSDFPRSVTITVILDVCQADFQSNLMGIRDDKGQPLGPGHVEVLQGTRVSEAGISQKDEGGTYTTAIVDCLAERSGSFAAGRSKTVADADFGNSDGTTWSLELHACAAPLTTLITRYCRATSDTGAAGVADKFYGDDAFPTTAQELSKCALESWRGGKDAIRKIITDASPPEETQHPTFAELGNPDKDPANPDIDGDGLSNVDEIKTPDKVTNPWKRDTDADGLKDSDEILFGCEPVDPDTDNDKTIDDDDPDCET